MRIILIGFGVVGQSVVQILIRRQSEILQEYGFNPKIVAIADSSGAAVKPEGLDMQKSLLTKQLKGTVAAYPKFGRTGMLPLEVLENVEAEVVVETTATNVKDGEPGLSHIKAAFKAGKHVVTTNKGPLALALPALTELADYNKVYLRFSGTVGGGTPARRQDCCHPWHT
jgi:homoserine dehydrogenase